MNLTRALAPLLFALAACTATDDDTPAATVAAPAAADGATAVPGITYTMPASPWDNVDLSWGTPATDDTRSDDNTATKAVRHALARLRVLVRTAYDTEQLGTLQPDDSCRVTLDRIVVRGRFPREGTLAQVNPVTNRAVWYFAPVTEDNEIVIDASLIDSTMTDRGPGRTSVQPRGVTFDWRDVLTTGADGQRPLLTVIPNAMPTDYEVELSYYVTIDDSKLRDRYVRVHNVERRRISLTMVNATEYSLHLLIGLSVVQLSATVADW